jgi:competence protein ComEC
MLALGVAGMLLVDPLLVTSLGFRLSVAGTGGIVIGAHRLEPVLPGPRWLATPLSVTLAAQAGVAPLLVAAFGSVPVASIPANLLAVPVAGPLMVWGLTAGLAAGIAPPGVARLLHVPTTLMLAWLDGVARAAAGWPLGQLRAPQLAALAAAATAMAIARRLAVAPVARTRAAVRVALAVTAVTAVAGAAVLYPSAHAARAGGEGPYALGAGATGWDAGGGSVAAIDGRATDAAVLAGLRARSVDHLDIVVVRTRAPTTAAVVATLRRRWPRLVVVAPPGAPIPGATSPPDGTILKAGALRLTIVTPDEGRLDVHVVPSASPDAPASAQSRSPALAPPRWSPPAARAPPSTRPAHRRHARSPPSSRSTRRSPATCR